VGLYDAAVAGAAPGPITAAALRELDVRRGQRVWLFAFGKAAHPMAAAAVSRLERDGHPIAAGVVIAPDEQPSPHPGITAPETTRFPRAARWRRRNASGSSPRACVATTSRSS
jgi:glycerate-2-kinase